MGRSGLPCPDGQLVLVGTLLATAPPPGWEASLVPSPAWFPGECPPRPLLPPEETPNVCPCHEVGGCAVGPWMPTRAPQTDGKSGLGGRVQGQKAGTTRLRRGGGVAGGVASVESSPAPLGCIPSPVEGAVPALYLSVLCCPSGQTPPHGCFLCSTQPAAAPRSSPLTSSVIQWMYVYIYIS